MNNENLFNSTVNFYNINNENFIEFLSKFYGDILDIKSNDEIHKKLINELFLLYDEFNEKGIDEKILKDKIDLFLESNQIIKKIDKLKNDTEEIKTETNNISSQLDTITKNKYDDVIISGNELSMKANGVVKKIIQLPSAGGMGNGVTPNITIGTVTTLEAGQQATVVNSGTKENPIFDFGIPKGENGSNGERGEQGERGANGKSVELTRTATHIKWRHTGQSEGVGWTDLVALEDIKGTFDTTTVFNSLNTTNKTIIGAINELFALIKNNGSGSENTTTSGIKVEPTSVNLKVNGTADVTMLFGSDVTNKSMEYMSSNGSVASVSDLGSYKYRITGVGQGNTTIRFRTSDGRFETSCSVTVTSSSTGGGSGSGSNGLGNEYETSCTSEYILDKMYPMGQAHESIPSGLITDTWKYNSRWENQDRPIAMPHSCGQSGCPGTGPFKALGCWSNVYRVEGTPFTQNTGVEMKDIKVYGWYNGAWELVQHLPVPNGNFYPESFGGDVNKYFADSVKQTSTSKTIILREKNKITAMNWDTGQPQEENCMYHPFSDIKNFDTKYEYIYTCIDLRKVKWDENGVDDRDSTHYCSNCGGDWWLSEGLTFHESWQHNKGVCQPKMIEITNEWRRFSMTTAPQNWQYGFPV